MNMFDIAMSVIFTCLLILFGLTFHFVISIDLPEKRSNTISTQTEKCEFIRAPKTEPPEGLPENEYTTYDNIITEYDAYELYNRIIDALDEHKYAYKIIDDFPWTIYIHFKTNDGMAYYAIDIKGPPIPPLDATTINNLFKCPENAKCSYHLYLSTPNSSKDFERIAQFMNDIKSKIPENN